MRYWPIKTEGISAMCVYVDIRAMCVCVSVCVCVCV